MALPSTVTLDQLKPQLKQLGVDVDALVAAVGPYLTPDETATLGQIASKPIPLHYVLSFNGTRRSSRRRVSRSTSAPPNPSAARPDFADLPTLTAMLNNHANVPEAAAAAKALQTLATAPATKLFEYTYQQTPESVADIASTVKSNRSQLLLVERYVPIGLFVAALVALVAGGLVLWHRHSSQPLDVRAHPPEAEQDPRTRAHSVGDVPMSAPVARPYVQTMTEATGPAFTPLAADAHLLRPLIERAAANPTAPVAAYRRGDEFVDVTAAEFLERVRALAKGLIATGVDEGDRVVLMSHTRLEWLVVDYAILAAGGVTVPAYETSSAEQLAVDHRATAARSSPFSRRRR